MIIGEIKIAILFLSTWDNFEHWQQQLLDCEPNLDIRSIKNMGNPDDIDIVLAWKPPAGIFSQLTNLKFIQSLGMGVDHLFECADLPRNIPIARIIDNDMGMQMSEYVLYGVLHHHRLFGAYKAQQQNSIWKPLSMPKPKGSRIGILGFGVLGKSVADTLFAQGFPISTWSNSKKNHATYSMYHGMNMLADFLKNTDILVNLLPLTSHTRGILNKSLFEQLPKGAFLINPARGAHLIEDDLLASLENNQLSGALLDVYQTEPLTANHLFWKHPKITLTPHIAAVTNPITASSQIIENYHLIKAGKQPKNQVEFVREY
ncbi:glyoxylate/hydroxypyruvate reductase A [Gammaproteobacteria bacterium]|nr:glyoxylate/hydroxypyruvate reductase A [Gammaproteobacteria bacterium]